LPNNAEVVAAIGYVHRRQGLADRGVPEIQQAMVLDPRNSLLPREVANSYTALRRYAEADAAYARSLAIFPGDIEAQEQRAASMMYSGDMAAAARILAAIPADTDPQGSVSLLRYKLAMTTRQPDVALAAIVNSPDWLMTRWEHSLAPLSLLRAQALALKGEAGPARIAFLRAEQELQSLLDKPHESADAQSYLGLVYAGLGQKEAALKAAGAAVDLLPMSRDVIVGAFYLERLARVEAQVGETESAIDHLSQLLSSAGGETVSVATLRIDPVWDPIRDDPRFNALLAKHAVGEKDAAR
jgi:tetratricopeptide (TPR) repeat protein